MRDQPDRVRFTADRGDARLRLDQVLVRRISEISRFSRVSARRWIESGLVSVERRPSVRPATRVHEGDTVEVTLPPAARRRVRPGAEPITLDVVFEDQHLLIVNKPAGMVVHPSYKRGTGTLLNGVLWHGRDRAEIRPGIVTRLDKDTSGLVIVAWTPAVHAAMQRDAAAGRIEKEYLALVSGVPSPSAGRITLPIGRDPADRRRMVAASGGAASETLYEVVSTFRHADGREGSGDPEWRSLVRCRLVTGRTHQIRVHLAASGWPIVGDRVYGRADCAIASQALHAYRVAFPHPVTRTPVEACAKWGRESFNEDTTWCPR